MPEHGTRARYGRGCRCEPCRDAHRRDVKAWRRRVGYTKSAGTGRATRPVNVDAAPVVEHMQRLLASGWRRRHISLETGIHQSAIARFLDGRVSRMWASRAARILALEPLAPVPVDDVAVDRFIDGHLDRDALTNAELIEAARRMDRAGVSRAEIARRVRLNSKALYGRAYREAS